MQTTIKEREPGFLRLLSLWLAVLAVVSVSLLTMTQCGNSTPDIRFVVITDVAYYGGYLYEAEWQPTGNTEVDALLAEKEFSCLMLSSEKEEETYRTSAFQLDVNMPLGVEVTFKIGELIKTYPLKVEIDGDIAEITYGVAGITSLYRDEKDADDRERVIRVSKWSVDIYYQTGEETDEK